MTIVCSTSHLEFSVDHGVISCKDEEWRKVLQIAADQATSENYVPGDDMMVAIYVLDAFGEGKITSPYPFESVIDVIY